MTKYFLSGLSLIALVHAAPAWAQTDPNTDNLNDEVISLGSRITPVALDVTTSAASILTEDDIQARGQAFLSDILRSLPGLAVSRSGAAGNLTQVRVRGSEANHVLVLIDGVEAGNPNTGEFDFAGIRSEDIVRIEVLRGEQSALWGSDAIGGVINITTRAGSNVESYKASVEVGTSETIEGQVSAVIPVGSAALSINGNAFSTEGFDISGLDGEDDGSDSTSISIGLNRVELGPLKLSALYSASNLRSEFDSDTDFDGRLNNTDNLLITDNRRANITGQFDVGVLKNKISLSLTQTDTSDPNASFQNDTEGQRLQANWAGEATIADAHTVTVLAEVEDEDFELFGGVGAGQNQSNNITNYALAGDYKYAHGPISLTGSVRQDFNDRFENSTTWRVGGGYKIAALNGRVYGSYGTGVKNPTLTEIFGFFPGSFIGNPDIQPETSEGFNIGYRQTFGSETGLGIGTGSVSVDYFQSDLEDEILTIFNPDFTSTVANSVADSSREGIEVQADWSPVTQLDFQGAITLLDAEEGDIEEIRRPDFTASASFTWRPIEALSLTGTLDHTGSQTDTDFGTFSNVELDAFTLIGGHIRYRLNDYLSLSVRGDNLLDETVEEVVGFSGADRTVFVGLSANF